MNLVLWIVAIVLAVAFALSGLMKLAQSREKLTESGMGWAGDFSAGAVKALGAVEILGAAGLVLPAALNVAPILVPVAAIGLAVVMVGAAVVHLRRRETPMVAINVVLLALAALVTWGRLGPYAF